MSSNIVKFGVFVLISFVSLVLLSIFTCSTASAADNSLLIQYKYKIGDKLRYAVKLKGKATMKTKAKEDSSPISVDMEISQNVLYINPKNSNIDLQMVIDKAYVTDSNGEMTDLQNVGKTVYVTMTPSGELLGISSYDANFDPNNVSISFPDKPIGVGESWSSITKATSQVPIAMEATYTLSQVKTEKGRRLAVVKSKTIIPKESQTKEIRATSIGEMTFDLDQGKIIKNFVHTEVEMRTSVQNDDPKLGEKLKEVTTLVNVDTVMELK